MSKPTITLDLAPIVRGLLNKSAKTGIYRYSYELLNALCNNEKIIASFWLSHYQFHSVFLENTLKSNGIEIHNELKPISFPAKAIDAISKTDPPVFQYCTLLINKLLKHSINHYDFNSKSHIFHSFFDPLPTQDVKSKKRLITIHDLIALKHPNFFLKRNIDYIRSILHSIDKQKDHIITVSQATKNDICNICHIPESRVHVTHLAANPSVFYLNDGSDFLQLNKRYGIRRKQYVLSLATVEPRKNYQGIIRAFSKLKTRTPNNDLKLVLVGNLGWKYKETLKTLHTHHLAKDIIFTGYVDDSLLSSLYTNAAAFVYPSFYEGFGLPVLEAMQCGCPVVTSNTSSMPEITADCGMLVDPNNEDEIADAIETIYIDQSIQARLSQQSIKRSSLFSWKKCANETVKCYEAILND